MNASPSINRTTLITDFDNTLYDWAHMWVESFSAMLAGIVRISGIDEGIIVPQIREVHQRYHTSEYAFLIEEIPAIKEKFAGQNVREIFDDAIHGYRSARKRSLKLYDGVLDTLRELKNRGVMIVVYTESLAYYTNFRILALGLDGVVDFVFSPPDHEIPDAAAGYAGSLAQSGNGGLTRTRHLFLPKGVTKPNPEVLLDIIRDIGRAPGECVYVGDSLMKDIAMAQDAGVVDILAAYGAAQERPGYDLLRRVSHWTEADVQRERGITRETVKPTHLIFQFSDILAFLGGTLDGRKSTAAR